MSTHDERLADSIAYHDKQKRRGRPKKADQETWYISNGDKIIEKTKTDIGIQSKYVGLRSELKEFLIDKNIITHEQDQDKRKVG